MSDEMNPAVPAADGTEETTNAPATHTEETEAEATVPPVETPAM